MFSLSNLWAYGLFIFPFLFIKGIPFPYIYPKAIFIQAWVAIGLIGLSFIKKEDEELELGKISLSFLALLVFGFISMLWAPEAVVSLFGPFWRGTGLVFYSAILLSGFLLKEKSIDKEVLTKLLLISGTLVSVIIIGTYFFGPPGEVSKILMGNPNATSMWVGTTILLNFLSGFNIYKKDKFLTGGTYLINIIALFMLGSRSSIGGVFLCLMLGGILSNKKALKVSLFTSLGIGAALLIQYFAADRSLLKTFIVKSKEFHRIDIWDGAWRSFLEAPFLGYGFHGLIQGYWENYTSSLIVAHAWNDNAHSIILNIAAELGVIGLILFGALCFFIFKELKLKEGHERAGWVAIISFISIYSLFQPYYVDSAALVLFIFFLLHDEKTVSFSSQNLIWKGSKIVLGLAFLVVSFNQFKQMKLANKTRYDIVGNKNYRKTWNSFMSEPSYLDKPGVFLEISNQMRLPYTPAGARYKALQRPFSSFMVESYKEHISRFADRPRSLENYAMWLVRKGDYANALTYLDKVLERSDQVTKAYFNKGHVYIKLKQFGKAQAMFRKVKKLNPNYKNIDAILSRFKN